MKTRNLVLRKTVLAAAVVLAVGGLSINGVSPTGETGDYLWMSAAYAAESGSGHGGGGKQGTMGAGRGGENASGAGGPGYRGGKSVRDVLSEDDGDDSSDRPTWAGVPGGEGRPGGGGNPKPGVTKGDVYGDMILLLRDPVTGLPVLDGGQLQVCTDPACETTVTMVDGEVPAGTTTFEVDLGRASVARAPTTVVDHALDEAISKLTADGAVITQDAAGRIVVTVGDVSSTIDSPLENLALFIDLMKGLASSATSDAEAALGSLATLDTAAALLAGVADKTGDISLDYLMNEMVIAGVIEPFDPADPDDEKAIFDFSSLSYTREYPSEYTYFYTPDGGTTVLTATADINAYLQAINGSLPDDAEDVAALFAAAADDALEVIELLHTQIHDGLLPQEF